MGGVAAAEIVRAELVFEPGVIVEGLNAQVSPETEEQLSEIWPLNPPTAAAPMVRFAEPPCVTDTLWVEAFREKFGPLTAAAGTTLAKTLVVLPPLGKLGCMPPPAVKYKVPVAPDGPPPPNTMSHNPGLTRGRFDVSVS